MDRNVKGRSKVVVHYILPMHSFCLPIRKLWNGGLQNLFSVESPVFITNKVNLWREEFAGFVSEDKEIIPCPVVNEHFFNGENFKLLCK